MTPGILLAVAAGGVVGAPARYLLDRSITGRHDSVLPWGTFAINVTGSLLLGVLVGLGLAGHLPSLIDAGVGTGFCGAFTTFSTFTFETVRLVEDGELRQAAAYLGGSVAVGLAAAAAGVALGLGL